MDVARELRHKRLGVDDDSDSDDDKKLQVNIRVRPPFQKERDPLTPSNSLFEPPSLSLSGDVDPTSEESLADMPTVPTTKARGREPDFIPFRESSLQRELMDLFDPEQRKLKWAIGWGVAAVLFLIALVFFPGGDDSEEGQTVSSGLATLGALCGAVAVAGFVAWRRRNESTGSVDAVGALSRKAVRHDEYVAPDSPSTMFVRARKQVAKAKRVSDVVTTQKRYTQADRATASTDKSSALANDPDHNASEAIKKLGLTWTEFNKYVSNMKMLISRAVLAKLVDAMHSDDQVVEAMLSVPRYEGCREYIKSRIRNLATSQSLATHMGDRGEAWRMHEWTSDLPSDNQIVLHVLSVWFSYFMSGRRGDSMAPVFNERHLFIKRAVEMENDDDILLCSDDYSQFYVYTKYKAAYPEKFYSRPGRDSMYGALTLFFWFAKEKHKFLLSGADFTREPICMDRTVFSMTRLI